MSAKPELMSLYTIREHPFVLTCGFTAIYSYLGRSESHIEATTLVKNCDGSFASMYILQSDTHFYFEDWLSTYTALKAVGCEHRLEDPKIVALISSVADVSLGPTVYGPRADFYIRMSFPRPLNTRAGEQEFKEKLFDFYRAINYGNSAAFLR